MSGNALERRRNFSWVGAIRGLFSGVVLLNAKSPYARSRGEATHIVKDVPYLDTGCPDHRLDVIRMRDAPARQPALLYIHGGGFAVCTKETHEILTFQYARMGFTVFSIDYRRIPEYRFPAGFHDCCDALLWVQNNAERYGADADNIVIAGESAGGNFTLGLAAAASYRDEHDAWAARVYDADPQISAMIPACGALQVSGIRRLWIQPHSDPLTRRILTAMQRDYLPRIEDLERPAIWPDPLLVVERKALTRPLPPTFTFCGTSDVLLHDTQRLGARLRALDVPVRCELFPGEMHAFQAFVWRDAARIVWRQQREFLAQHVEGITPKRLSP